jgi:hypothetical protein
LSKQVTKYIEGKLFHAQYVGLRSAHPHMGNIFFVSLLPFFYFHLAKTSFGAFDISLEYITAEILV